MTRRDLLRPLEQGLCVLRGQAFLKLSSSVFGRSSTILQYHISNPARRDTKFNQRADGRRLMNERRGCVICFGIFPDLSRRQRLFEKVLSSFRHNLRLGHFVSGFNANYMPREFFALDAFFKLALGLAWTKYQDRFSIMNK